MDNSQPTEPDPETVAHQLVGKFLQNFALMEQALDLGIGKLLGLTGGANDIVCSSIPFAKKVDVFFSAEGLFAAIPDAGRKKNLEKVASALMDLNNKRVIFAHNPFRLTDGGISLRRVVANKKLKVSTVTLTAQMVSDLCDKASRLVGQLENLVEEMVPYKPSLDFSDARNSGYISLI